MRVTTTKTIKISLELNEDESRWLKDIMQNPLHKDESLMDSEMREEIFTTLKEAME